MTHKYNGGFTKMQICRTLAAIGLVGSVPTAGALTEEMDHPTPIRQWPTLMNLEQPHETIVVPDLALADGSTIGITLDPFSIMSPGGFAVIESAAGTRDYVEEELVHLYRGTVNGSLDSRVYMAATATTVNGFVRIGTEDYIVSSGPNTGTLSNQLFITPLRGGLDAWIAGNDFCHVDEIAQPFVTTDDDPQQHGSPRGDTCVIIEIAVETDWEYTSSLFGGDAEASLAYAMTLMGAVSEIYVEDMQVRLELSYVRTWADNSDPYPSNAENRLDEFRSHWNSNMFWVHRDLAHLLSKPFSGGLAWVSVVCNSNWGYAVSGSLNGEFPYPLQDNHWNNWDPVVVAHELGHNFSCLHTHDLGIDGCGQGDCTDADQGTIMSYCHLCWGGMSNIRLGFHPQNQARMNSMFASNSCDSVGSCLESAATPIGACCNGGTCWVSTEANCTDDWLGADTTCDGSCDSNDPIGACCNGILCSVTTASNCEGSWLGSGTNCNDAPCGEPDPVGGCCLNFNCSITTEVDCQGDWLGEGTNCIGTPCGTPDPVGACCEGNFCWVGTESTCSGEWLGANTNCVSSPCASGPAFLIVPLDYPTIQAAIDASSNGDTVLVVAGTYTGSGSEVIKTRGRGITIRSLAGAAVTTIDGEGLRHVVSCTNNESSTTIIEGFTITGGAGNWGGGIFCGGSSPSFTDCIITDNTATTRGGGAYTFQCSPIFTGCVWSSNTSEYGAAIYSSNASPTIVGGEFKNNTASASGGALHGSSGGITLVGASLCHNLPSHISGQWVDGGDNTMNDTCQGCATDIGEGDSIINSLDIQSLLDVWGSTNETADFDGSGFVGIGDLLIMLASWGPC
ncbi:MAG: hypothetical protein HOO04_08625 [Phycisphaerae bacterium]|jgi:hypothetical protein|nr:hypothetical protein [Phycisphaerae bacterium]MBT5656164.1 hypothetical protein [Phycisphaerae bacterium]